MFLKIVYLQDFEAFKKYSNSLLQKEREINDRLKHLAEWREESFDIAEHLRQIVIRNNLSDV